MAKVDEVDVWATSGLIGESKKLQTISKVTTISTGCHFALLLLD